MTADPVVRHDGLCLTCHQPRKPPARLQKGLTASVYDDPFCSAPCARTFYGTSVDYRPCKGCGIACDDRTIGCERCDKRFEARRDARRRGIAA